MQTSWIIRHTISHIKQRILTKIIRHLKNCFSLDFSLKSTYLCFEEFSFYTCICYINLLYIFHHILLWNDVIFYNFYCNIIRNYFFNRWQTGTKRYLKSFVIVSRKLHLSHNFWVLENTIYVMKVAVWGTFLKLPSYIKRFLEILV